MGLFQRLLLDRRWRNSQFRRESAALMLLVGGFFGAAPPQIEPTPTEIATPLAERPGAGAKEIRSPD